MDKTSLAIATSNQAKRDEFSEMLDLDLEMLDIDLPEIQSVDTKEVVSAKARDAFHCSSVPVVVEDTGLFIDAWNGLPGALVRWFVDRVGEEGIVRMLASEHNRKAIARSVIGIFDGTDVHIFEGEIAGTITEVPRGTGGFGWDPIFIPDGYQETFAEMTLEKKNSISMRKIAVEKLRLFLRQQGKIKG